MAYTLEQTARRINLLVANEKQLAPRWRHPSGWRQVPTMQVTSLWMSSPKYGSTPLLRRRFSTTYCTSGFASRSRPLHSPRSISPEKNLLRLRRSSAHGSPSRLQTKGVNT